MKTLCATIICLTLMITGSAQANFEIGGPVDDFTLLDLQGAAVSLSDFEGQVVLINFFATWCPPCNDEVPLLQELYQTYQEEGLVILGIDLLEDETLVSPWVQSYGLTYPIVLSPDYTLFQLFPEAGGFPYNAVIDRSGLLQYGQHGINMEEIEILIQHLLDQDPVADAPITMDAVKALYR